MLRVVFDTNIYISAFLFGGLPEQLIRAAPRETFHLYISPDILNEVSAVLVKKFHYDAKAVDQIDQIIKDLATIVRPNITINAIPHWPADNRVLECAITAQADYLVTGDTKHLLPLKRYQESKIISAREFLELLG